MFIYLYFAKFLWPTLPFYSNYGSYPGLTPQKNEGCVRSALKPCQYLRPLGHFSEKIEKSFFGYEGQRCNTYEHLECIANPQGTQRILNFVLFPPIPLKLLICLPRKFLTQKLGKEGRLNQKQCENDVDYKKN